MVSPSWSRLVLQYNDQWYLEGQDKRVELDQRLIHEVALTNAKRFADGISDLQQAFASWPRANGLSWYWFSDWANKRSEFDPAFYDYCVVQTVLLLIEEYQVQSVFCIRFPARLVANLRSVQGMPPVRSTNSTIVRTESWKTIWYRHARFLFTIMRARYTLLTDRSLRRVMNRGSQDHPHTWYTSMAGKNWKNGADRIWGIDRDMFFILANDGLHDYWTYRKHKVVKGAEEPYLLFEQNTRLLDYVVSYARFFVLMVWLTIRNRRAFVDEIDLAPYFRQSIKLSFRRLPRLFPVIKGAERLGRSLPSDTTIRYYLHEYVFGRAFACGVRAGNPAIRLEGYQHGPISRLKMLHWLGRNERELQHHRLSPFPDRVVAEDVRAARLYEICGFRSVVARGDLPPRLSYMHGLHQQVSTERNTQYALVVGGLHDSQKLYDWTIQNSDRFSEMDTVAFRAHPKAKVDRGPSDQPRFSQLIDCDGSIEDNLKKATLVVATYSSVGLEAASLGISTWVVCLPGRLNESPLIDEYFEGTLSDHVKIIWG